MASQGPGEQQRGAGDVPGVTPPPDQPLPGQGPPVQPPPGQPLHGRPLHRQPSPAHPPAAQPLPGGPAPEPPPRSPISDNRFAVVLLSIVAVVVVLGLGGCAVLSAVVNSSVQDSTDELNATLRKSQDRKSITEEQAKAVKVGEDRNEIVRRFGPPAFGPAKQPVLPPEVRDCISWHIRGGPIGSVWEFCFRSGRLVEKESDLDPSPRGRRPPPGGGTPPSQQQ